MAHVAHPSCRYWLRLLLFAAGILAALALVFLVYLIDRQLQLLVVPQRDSEVGLPLELQRPYEEITLTTQDGLDIAAWYIPGTRPHAIILVHGINTNRRAVLPQAALLAEAGYPLLLLDLRGHGQSEGHEVTYGYREAYDLLAALDYLDRQPGLENFGVFGTSLGGAVAVRAAALDLRLQAIVIEDSYSSLNRAIEAAFDNFSLFPRWPFAPLLIFLAERRLGIQVSQVDSTADLAKLDARAVLIIHHRHNALFPLSHAEEMYAAAREPKTLWVVEGDSHETPALERKEEFKAHVLPFFEEAFAANRD